MIDFIRKQLKPEWALEEKIHYTREFLQVLLLKILYDKEQFQYLAFVGGTALRLLYDLNRFSEDLDFCLVQKKGYSFSKLIQGVKADLVLYSLAVDLNVNEQKTVQNVMIRFRDLLYQLGLSPLRDQKLSIRLEIDNHPPRGGMTQVGLINRYFLFSVNHFDLASLFATKLHACFYRKYTKGRDFYDLVWYLGKKIKPNVLLLNNAVLQTEKVSLGISEENFFDFLREWLEKVDFSVVRKDVERFLADKKELALINKETILSFLK